MRRRLMLHFFHRLTYCNVGTFGGHPWQFCPLRLLLTHNCQRENYILGSICGLFFSPLFFFFLFFVCLSACFLCASHHEVKALTNLRKPQQYSRTASTTEQPVIGSAQSSNVHTAVRSWRADSRVRERTQVDKKTRREGSAGNTC